MPSRYIDVEIDLADFSDDELIDELEDRGITVENTPEEPRDILYNIWHLRRTNQPYDHLMDDLLYLTIGKLV